MTRLILVSFLLAAMCAGCASTPLSDSMKALRCIDEKGTLLIDLTAKHIAHCPDAAPEFGSSDLCLESGATTLRVLPGAHLCVVIDPVVPAPSPSVTALPSASPTPTETAEPPPAAPERRGHAR